MNTNEYLRPTALDSPVSCWRPPGVIPPTYKVDTDAVSTKVKQEFAAKEKLRSNTASSKGGKEGSLSIDATRGGESAVPRSCSSLKIAGAKTVTR